MADRRSVVSKLSIWILCIIVAVSMLMTSNIAYAESTGSGETTYYDGTYEGIGQGRNGDIKVSVKISDGAIAAIEVTQQNETSSYWEMVKGLPDSMVSQQTADVDAVSGATQSSVGLKAAVKDALAKASIDPSGWYAAGDGSASKPFIINTAQQLAGFAVAVDEGDDLAGKYVALGSDITLDAESNFNPIGTEGASNTAKKFAGTFDGKGYTIDKLTYKAEELSAETNVGLFATLDKSAVVKNVNLTNVDIDIKGSAVLRAGGIAADTASGTAQESVLVDSCSVTGNVSADSSGAALVFAAGLIGRGMTWAKAANCYTDVDVTAISRGGNNSAYAGGIVGMSGNNTLIANCAAFGDSYGSSPKSTNFGGMAGGLGGMLTSKVYNNYAAGNVTIGHGGATHEWVGALAGEFPSGGMTNQGGSYIYPDTGAFRDYGYYADDVVLTVEKWAGADKTVTTPEVRAVGVSTTMNTCDKIFETKAEKVARSEMSTQSFADTLNGNLKGTRKLMDAYSYQDVQIKNWRVEGGKVLPTGDVYYSSEPDASIFESGEGTQEDPYQIKTEGQLRAFAVSLNAGVDYDGYFVKVVDDIDISSSEWTPIGGQEYAFNGTFDGGSHKIKGMKAGSESETFTMGRENPYMGFFGVLGKDAVVKDVDLTDVNIYAYTPQYVYLGGIAAINDATAESKKAMIIDGCSVTGNMTVTAEKSNAFLGGIIAQQYRGAIINCWTDIDLKCIVKTGNAIAEVGGLVGLNNRGLVANSYTLGDVYGSASRSNGDEGMASTGNLVGVQAGDLVGCYSKGDNTTAEYSVYAGELAGWITGIGKVYSCYYNKEAKMTIDGRSVDPPADFGTKVAPGVNEEGDAYVGGIVDELVAYTASDFAEIAAKMNAKFDEYPIDTEIYGISGDALKKWKYDSETSAVTFADSKAATTYKQPQAEIVPPEVEEMRDGTWFGRDADKKTVVKIEVKNNEIVGEPEVVSGDVNDQEAFDAALSSAKSKAIYADRTAYGQASADLFGGGKGTKDDPYLISSEKQLRAIAEALNEDERFADVYFKQTCDIDVSSKEWLPIGHAILGKVKKSWTQVAAYPFLGNYDGNGYKITGLTIGKEGSPSDDPQVNFTAGMFGFVSGDHYSNEKITEDVRVANLKNIKLRGVDINVSSEGQNYTGGLLGNGQNGVVINNCSVTGKLTSFSKDSFARGAGLAGNVIRGTVLNCWTDMDIYAETDAGNTYAGGLYAIDNRVTSINCYSLGSVTGNAAANNKVHIGGLSGQAGGLHYNCYVMGDVTSLKTTSDAGLVEGRLAGIAVDSKVYFSKDAKLTVAGTQQEAQPIGVSIPADPDVTGMSSADMKSQKFVDLLNENASVAAKNVDSLQEIINGQTDLTHVVQFSGKAEDLLEWKLDGVATFLDPRDEEIAAEEAKLELLKELAAKELMDQKVSEYSGEALSKLIDALADAKERIANASSIAEVESIVAETKESISKIQTKEQGTADDGKDTDAKLDEILETVKELTKDKSDGELQSMLEEIKKAISSGVDSAVESAKIEQILEAIEGLSEKGYSNEIRQLLQEIEEELEKARTAELDKTKLDKLVSELEALSKNAPAEGNDMSDKLKEILESAKALLASDTTSGANTDPGSTQAGKDTAKTTANTATVKKGAAYTVSGNKYKVAKVAKGKTKGTVTFTKAKNKKNVTVPKTVKLKDKKTYKVIAVAAKAFTGKKIRTVTIGANVKTIKKNAFAKSKAKTMIVKTKKLTKKSVKGSLKSSKISAVKVKVGKAKVNKKYIKKYKKIFTKKNAGRKVKVK